MGSTRLPGKSLLPLAGAPLLQRILERVKRCKLVDVLVVATTQKGEDDPLADLARSLGVEVFRGSEDDLVDRYYRAAVAFDLDLVGRLPADNPVPEPSEIDRIIAYHKSADVEFSSNLTHFFGNGYPDGIGAEVFDLASLAHVWRTSTDPRDREHLHLNFFDYGTETPRDPARFRIGTVECPPEFRRPDLVLDVNTPDEYGFLAALYGALFPSNPAFSIGDIIAWYDAEWCSGQQSVRGMRPSGRLPPGRR